MRLHFAAVLLWSSAACVVRASQIPFGASYASSGDGFADHRRIELPLEASAQSGPSSVADMIAAENGNHVVLTHQEFPQLSVRIKHVAHKTSTVDEMMAATSGHLPKLNHSDPNAFCDPTVDSWSGYVDLIDGKSLFFYFFESRRDPSKDPVLLWLTGGPGCSSALGLFMELGPCLVPERNGTRAEGPPINATVWNPYSWNSVASTIFLDQPVDVGYSYSRYGVHTFDSDQGSKDVYAFLRIIFSAFHKLQGNDFVMTGESYAGRYIPRYASQIVDENHKLLVKAERSEVPVNKSELIHLKKVAIGNGLTDVAVQTPSYYDFTCTRKGGVDPVLSIEVCKELRPWRDQCLKWMNEVCRDSYDEGQCAVASEVCDSKFGLQYFKTGLNPYNIKDQCRAGLAENLCYAVSKDIRVFMDREDVRELVGAEPISSIGAFESCNSAVNNGFAKHGDKNANGVDFVAGLLERDIEVLIYVGKLDWICNHVGNRAWVDRMEWTGRASFHANKQYSFVVDGEDAGQTQEGGGLTWATIEGAGHMVPHDKPKVALQLISRFLDGEKL